MNMESNLLIQTFLEESAELLHQLEDVLLMLEDEPEDAESINTIFRIAHTLKGSAGMCELTHVVEFTHYMENMLDQRRAQGRGLDKQQIELFLNCNDHVNQLIKFDVGLSDISEQTLLEQGLELETSLKQYIADNSLAETNTDSLDSAKSVSGNWHISIQFGPDSFRYSNEPSSFISHLASLGEILQVITLIDKMPAAADMDPETCYLGFEIILNSDSDRETIADVFDFIKEDCQLFIHPPETKISDYLEHILKMPDHSQRLGELLINAGLLTHNELQTALNQQRNLEEKSESDAEKLMIGELLIEQGSVHEPVVKAALDKQQQVQELNLQRSVIKVSADKLDELVNLVGEMVIVQARLKQVSMLIDNDDLDSISEDLEHLITDLRENAFNIRMVQIGNSFNRFRRLVRDLSKQLSKDIRLETEGADTELDKTVIDQINEPLIHLIRNCIDHGIESPEQREQCGKNKQGRILLKAEQSDSHIIIKIIDDGSGIDAKAIQSKLLEKGLITKEDELTEQQLINMIFEPGFSTAKSISNVSGRGVGMDVVRRSIEALRGHVELYSQQGKGSTVIITLPLTLAIIEGLLIQVGEDNYVIPLNLVEQCIEITVEDLKKSHGEQVIDIRDEPVPFIRMREWFGSDGEIPEIEQMVICQLEDRMFGLVVDRVVGQHQTVVKNLGKFFEGLVGISSATILGDGTVALILDVPKMYQSIKMEQTNRYQKLTHFNEHQKL